MRRIHAPKTRNERRYRRHLRVRKKLRGTPERPRLVVHRSLKHIYAQLVDDDRGVTLMAVSDRSEGVDPKAERFVGEHADMANAFLKRAYRRKYVVPSVPTG